MAIRTGEWDFRFIYFSLLQNAAQFRAASTGLIPGLSRSDILDQPLPMPPSTPEQAAIAEVFTNMAAELARLQQRREKTRALKDGMMQELLTGRTRIISAEESYA
jgi:type I restriction enzyme S subunit